MHEDLYEEQQRKGLIVFDLKNEKIIDNHLHFEGNNKKFCFDFCLELFSFKDHSLLLICEDITRSETTNQVSFTLGLIHKGQFLTTGFTIEEEHGGKKYIDNIWTKNRVKDGAIVEFYDNDSRTSRYKKFKLNNNAVSSAFVKAL